MLVVRSPFLVLVRSGHLQFVVDRLDRGLVPVVLVTRVFRIQVNRSGRLIYAFTRFIGGAHRSDEVVFVYRITPCLQMRKMADRSGKASAEHAGAGERQTR